MRATMRLRSWAESYATIGALALAVLVPACGGGTVMSGAAVGRVGSRLSAQAAQVPQGATVCSLHEAAGAASGTTEKPVSEACTKASNSDELWRRALIVLSAHGDRLSALSSGTKPEHAGRLEAAMTGVTGTDFVQTDDAKEKAARDAVVQLVGQMEGGKGALDDVAQRAAPQVKTLCDGLDAYFTAQLTALAETRADLDKKRTTLADRRCAALDSRTLCVSQSVLDRVTYATTFGDLSRLETSHQEALDSVRLFCIVHRKLEEASAKGAEDREQTWVDIVNTVKSTPRSRPAQGGASPSPEKK